MGLKYKVMERFIHHRNYLEKGLSLTYWVLKFGQLWVLGEVYFKMVVPEKAVTTLMITSGVAVYLILMWFIGMLWDRHGVFIIETEWSNKRNKFVNEMRRKYNLKEGEKK